jgi:hypothetical protein
VLVKGKGSALPLPFQPMSPPVTVQLNNSVGECWEAVFSTVIRNDSQHYKAKF